MKAHDLLGKGRDAVAARLRVEAHGSVRFGSPLYGALIERAAQDVESGGPLWAVLEGLHADIRRTFLALHLMAAVHRLVLEGGAPEVAAHFPSVGGDGDPEGAWTAMRALVADRPDDVRRFAARPIQTNEPGRSAALLGGFLLVAERTGLPLRTLEVGASAGLNLRWDRFRYESSPIGTWGDPAARLRFTDVFEGAVPPVRPLPEVVSRAGCDANPLDPTTEEGRFTLMSYVWADQLARVRQLDAAIEIAREHPAPVERANALEWLPRMLERPAPGAATVVFHSVFLHYLSKRQRANLAGMIGSAGAAATSEAPLAELSLEPRDLDELPPSFEVRLRVWPGGTDDAIAAAVPHGPPVRWLGASANG